MSTKKDLVVPYNFFSGFSIILIQSIVILLNIKQTKRHIVLFNFCSSTFYYVIGGQNLVDPIPTKQVQ